MNTQSNTDPHKEITMLVRDLLGLYEGNQKQVEIALGELLCTQTKKELCDQLEQFGIHVSARGVYTKDIITSLHQYITQENPATLFSDTQQIVEQEHFLYTQDMKDFQKEREGCVPTDIRNW